MGSDLRSVPRHRAVVFPPAAFLAVIVSSLFWTWSNRNIRRPSHRPAHRRQHGQRVPNANNAVMQDLWQMSDTAAR
jgi:hypothetical protein